MPFSGCTKPKTPTSSLLQPIHYFTQLDYSTQPDYLTQPGICLRLRFLAKKGESGQGETGGVEVLEV
jgi:hypothetical protein